MKRREAIRRLAIGGTASVIGAHAKVALPVDAAHEPGSRRRSARFVHFTDVHVHPGRSAAKGLAKAIRHVHGLTDRPEFIINGGDAIGDALEVGRDDVETQWGLWEGAWKENGSLTVRHCLGNHDVWGWNKAKSKTNGDEPGWGKQLALDHLGLERSYYRFDQAKWRFLVLDSMTFDQQFPARCL